MQPTFPSRGRLCYDTFDRINAFTLSVLGKNIFSSVAYSDFGQVNSFTNTIGDRVDTISYTYDDFMRTTSRKLEAINKTSTYSYLKGNDGQDTVLVETLNNGKDTYKYTYDIYGNITSVAKNGTVVENYQYDKLNQLTYAKIGEDVYRYTYSLNKSSNLEFVYKNGKIIKTYGYMSVGDGTWVDKLSSFTGTVITYDSIGNPLNWRDNMSFNWSYGRRLSSVTKGSDSISYTYDADGLRTSKTVNGTTTDYYWLEGVLQGQKTGNEHIIFLYDQNGTAYGMLVNNNGVESYYYYLFNLQGDIVGIMDSTGNTVVEYTYDAWGQLLSTTGTLADTIGQKNPLRYRGYYYDTETGFYYLQSRYYDPYVQRFINADGYVSTGQGISGYNMFAYCGNNPIMHKDPNGENWFTDLLNKGLELINNVVEWFKTDVGYSASYGIEESDSYEYYYFYTVESGYGYSKDFGTEKDVNMYANYEWYTGGSLGIDFNYEGRGLNFEIGTDTSIGIHAGNVSYDIGASQWGRIYFQQTVSVGDGYVYDRFSINAAEIFGTLLVAYYAPQCLPNIGYIVYRCYA